MPELPPEVDPSRPHPARVYDYLIGGENNFAADRATAARCSKRSPNAHVAARENRAFLGRAVRYLAAEAGIRQFLDIGSRAAHREQRARGGPVGRPRVPGRLRRQRPAGAGARARPAHLGPGGPDRLHPRRRARPAGDPGQPGRPRGAGLRPPGRAHARRAAALHRRTRTGPRRSSRPCSTRCRPARTWPRRTCDGARHGRGGRRPAAMRRGRDHHAEAGPRTISPGWRSPALSWCRPAWCSSPSGGRPGRARARRPPRSTPTAGSPASPDAGTAGTARTGLARPQVRRARAADRADNDAAAPGPAASASGPVPPTLPPRR